MTTRISTAGMYAQGLSSILAQQSRLARTQAQLGTGLKINSAADDPVGAGSAVALDRSLAELERFGKNSNVLVHRLSQQENALDDVGDHLNRVRELAIQASSPVLSPSDRKAISDELTVLRQGLIGLANSNDGSGRYLFAGTQDGSAPFVVAGGAVTYVGDQVQKQVDVAPGLAIGDTTPGSEIFLRARTGDGTVSFAPGAANTGAAVLSNTSVTNASAWDQSSYQVNFTAANAYEVRDSANALVASGTYTPGESIAFRGVQVTATGTPNPGDTFDVRPAPARDIFATVQGLIDALGQPSGTAAERATMQNKVFGALQDVATAQDHVLNLRASGGARLAELETATAQRDAQGETIENTLTDLRVLDYAEAATRLSQQRVALEAAQSSFLRIQSLSLFDMLR